MITIVYSSVLAFCVSVGVMPTVAKVARQLGAVSETGGRHVGEVPIGRLGGFGVLLGCLVAILIQAWMNVSFRLTVIQYKIQAYGVLIGLTIVAIVGFLDDFRRLSATVKFACQIFSVLVLYWCGVRISAVDLPLLEPFELGWFSLPVTILWIVGIINAINLIDGLDGLAGGVLFFASMVNLVVAVVSNELMTAVLMSSVVGAVLGFLLFNWYPAKIYLGDGGAYSLGFLIAVSGLISPMHKVSTGIAIIIPVLAAGLPIIDTILVMVRRIVTRSGVFSPDRGHLHHILLDSGISHQRVVIGLYFVCCMLCSIALALVLHRNKYLGWLLIGMSSIGVIGWGLGVKSELRRALIRFIERFSTPKKNLNGDDGK